MLDKNSIIQVHEDSGVRTALVITIGPKYIGLIWAGPKYPAIRIRKVPANKIRYKEINYPLSKAKRLFRKMGATLGITKSAKRALRG